MATNKWSIIILLAMVATLATSVSAKSINVGDDKGWTAGIDYQAWASGKKFFVGDELIFKYPPGKHNVFQVDETGFQQCKIPSSEPLSSGQDSVKLDSPRVKSFICGIGKHCEAGGLKLSINVLPQSKTVSTAASPLITSKEIVVGDDKGWTKNFDYQAWANGKEFCVGDKLVFKYPVGKHNVLKVNETSFEKCIIPPADGALTSGNDIITIDKPGKEWFICGIGKHCEMGMKLCVDVLPKPTNTPNPLQGTRKLVSGKY